MIAKAYDEFCAKDHTPMEWYSYHTECGTEYDLRPCPKCGGKESCDLFDCELCKDAEKAIVEK